nr:hypothetical protein [Nitrosomonas nitrosa]
MGKVEAIEQEIEKFSPTELAALRIGYAAFDAEAWNRQFEADVKVGKLDAMAGKVLRAFTSGQSSGRCLTTHLLPNTPYSDHGSVQFDAT